ncbi:MAG: electron transport complex subunit RsxE [Zetaproteobacteria bacterium CG_4_9_14_3_um_filter_49_83]|nr:MAG: electron transport complex subunit RsxE [Zetaproteobacteria bacterium CG17_big_fil_post_rev_8_21_14_2_50_50_13]PIV30455.1 MAG: electron transport complex subunit RsxE [Zetaproteobacteria bacterium CG02_land_8_20_14_3_00_50_9]PIY55421.1 MAG: electron transport complex subunit RsxE [Zetaproteobacteria bacterium CG_4_10_14_0_8_um_filter_49_80]PJA34564.1 MAG: electron transport complex subunit RsxE [Zetaproteobacteria bacterium CG_4_9_14_3_um_filter_49_83]
MSETIQHTSTVSATTETNVSQHTTIFIEGFWTNNTIFAQLLGMCPLLGVTTSAENGFWMGAATVLVLLGSNLVVSIIRGVIPQNVRIPAYITIIAAFVTIVDMVMNAWMHEMYLVLGLFIPLIVVNCAILGRAEAFASKNSLSDSLVDAIAVGSGFTFALVLLGSVRELLGQGQLFGFDLFGQDYPDVLMFILPPGAFIALGFILAGVNIINARLDAKKRSKHCARTQ